MAEHFPLDPPGEEPQRPSDYASDEALSPANKSLLDALRLSFRILQIVMVLLVLVYLRTGYTIIPEQQKGIRLTFGKMHTGDALEPGGHASWPEPMGEFIVVRTATQELSSNEAFWLKLRENERALPFSQINRSKNQGLVPGEDGAVITADMGLAHTRWRLTYRVVDPQAYVKNVYRQHSDRILTKALERGVVHAAATVSLDEIISQRDRITPMVKARTQQMLDAIESGVFVESVSLTESRPPRQVLDAYESVNTASAEARRIEQEALAEKQRILNEAAGSAYQDLIPLLDRYEDLSTRAAADPSAVEESEALLQRIDGIMRTQAAGRVAQTIGDAMRQRVELVTTLQKEARQHAALFAQYLANPELTVTELWARAIEEVMEKDFIRFWLGDDTSLVDIRLNRPAEVLRRWEMERNRQLQQREQ